MAEVYRALAGIDVHKKMLVVAVRLEEGGRYGTGWKPIVDYI